MSVMLQVEKVMRALYIKSVYLWPRFEADVKDCLKASEEGLDLEVSLIYAIAIATDTH